MSRPHPIPTRLRLLIACLLLAGSAADAKGPPAAPPTADYLMVGPAEWLPELDRLVAFHERRGRVVLRRPIEETPTADALKLAIRALNDAGGDRLRFVLLAGDPAPGGDAPSVPACEAMKLDYAGFGQFPTDLPYGRLAGPPEGGPGRQLAIGRFPARNRAELKIMVDKTLAYAAVPGGEWQRRLALFGGPAKFTPFLDGIIESQVKHLLDNQIPYDFDLSFVFAKPDSPYTWRPDDLAQKITRELDRGAILSAYFGHGLPTAFDYVEFGDKYYPIGEAASLGAISAENGPPVFVALACDIGAFDLPGGDLSLAEVLFQNPKGPVAVVASARESHPYPNALYGQALIDAFLRQRAPSIGEGLVRAKALANDHRLTLLEAFVEVDVGTLLDEHAALYNLLGDPALPLRYTRALTVETSPAGSAPAGSTVEVRVSSGEATALTFETRRDVIRGALEPLVGKEHAEALEAMTRNWATAIDKVVSRFESDGKLPWMFQLPKEPGSYIIKALGAGKDAASGFLRFEVLPVPAPAP